jgi:hypothetical protein
MSTLAVNSVTDANGGNTATINSMTPTADSLQGFRNRILNGGMVIDQRNAGASITASGYAVDRFFGEDNSDAVFTLQQDSSAPAGFTKSVKATITTADASIGATQFGTFAQFIEGTNVADLGFGSASAKTVTLSFWVRSSLTGTFGGVLTNSSFSRAYPFTYTISVADTWEYKTITVPGDTSGTWLTTTAVGLRVIWSLGAGSTYTGTAGSWAGATYVGATGQTQVIGTLNATWYITGVQLEVGSVATPFERIDYGRQLIQCQRYYWKVTGVSGDNILTLGAGVSSTQAQVFGNYPVQMRTTPTVGAASLNLSTVSGSTTTVTDVFIGNSSSQAYRIGANVASGLTANSPYFLRLSANSGYFEFSSEL